MAHLRHWQGGGLARIVVGCNAFAEPADFRARIAPGAGVHELVVVPAQPNERLRPRGEQAVRLEEVRPRVRARRQTVVLDAPLHPCGDLICQQAGLTCFSI